MFVKDEDRRQKRVQMSDNTQQVGESDGVACHASMSVQHFECYITRANEFMEQQNGAETHS